jgi:uncharacterized protein (DUF4213/DUF364 family)
VILNEIREWLSSKAALHSIREVRIGLGYTAVQIDNGACGLAYTLHDQSKGGCCHLNAAGTLRGRSASDLVQWACSADPIAAAVGLATLNALTEVPAGMRNSDMLERLEVRCTDTVGMVGYFGPFADALRPKVHALHIFERRPDSPQGVLPELAAPGILPSCEVVILSATTLLNNTLEPLLDCCGAARAVAIVGPTAPFCPEIFRLRGVTLLSGVRVVDAERVLEIISQGGGTRQLGKAVEKWTWPL